MHSVTIVETSVKPSILTAIVAGFVVVVLALRNKGAQSLPAFADANIRYGIDEYIAEEEL